MRLDHDRAAGGQGGGGVSAGDREGQREVARTEYGDWTDGDQHAPEVGARTHGSRCGGVDGRFDVAAFLEDLSEKFQLETGSGQLTVQPGRAQRGFAIG